jgi:hypothetical protein
MKRRDFLSIVPTFYLLQLNGLWQGQKRDRTPGTPCDLQVVTANRHSITVAWQPPPLNIKSMGSGLAGYEVMTDGGDIVDAGNNLAETINYLGPNTGHAFQVRAYDNNGNRSDWSSAVIGTTADYTPIYRIDCGRTAGGVVSGWDVDQFSVNGSTDSHAGTPDLTGLTSPAPSAVYQTLRKITADPTNATPLHYTITGLTPDTVYKIRLHYCIHTTVINTTSVYVQEVVVDSRKVSNVQYPTGLVAQIRELFLTSDGSGEIDIQWTNNSGPIDYINGIEVLLGNAPDDSVVTQIIYEGDSISSGYPYANSSPGKELAALIDGNYYAFDSPLVFDPTNLFRVKHVATEGETLSPMYADISNQIADRLDMATGNILIFAGGTNHFHSGDSPATVEAGFELYFGDPGLDGYLKCVCSILPSVPHVSPSDVATFNDWLEDHYNDMLGCDVSSTFGQMLI